VRNDGPSKREASVTDFEKLSREMVASIRLGYEVERDDSSIAFETPPDREIEWLAGWLVSEGGQGPTDGPSTAQRSARSRSQGGVTLSQCCSEM
jgi:hypothetical protein